MSRRAADAVRDEVRALPVGHGGETALRATGESRGGDGGPESGVSLGRAPRIPSRTLYAAAKAATVAYVVTPAAAAARVTASPVLLPLLGVVFAVVSIEGGILPAPGSSIPIGPDVTTISFVRAVCRGVGRTAPRGGDRGGRCHNRRDRMPHRSKTTRPSKTVRSTRTSVMSCGSRSSSGRSRTHRSAALPDSIVPFQSSAKSCQAGVAV